MRGVAEAKRSSSVRVLVYSNDADSRSQIMLALGRRPHADLPPLEYLEVATGPVVIEHMDTDAPDLLILDGESAPTGGLGLAKQLKDEIADCPPIVVITGRPDDAWLANWSRADAAVSHPIDPIRLTEAVLGVLRSRSAA
ncbi:response regulator [Nocardia yamanashiensis]|uniref:Rv3143 family two-component system response regulator n=1 Tax=Nocardia yamanashiensis TaxID=209247 RepID=UPI001E2AFACB|nr:response regulator [Nocardia yamanashiensis]UGT43755.1 response regulator [Nocardia yamanashiensis]